MSLVTPYINKLEKIKQDIPRVATRAIVENAEIIIEVLKENQLSKGMDASGSIVGRYKPATINYMNDPNTRPRNTNKNVGDPYNFEWYGELFDSFNLKVNAQSQTFEIYSTTGKDRLLEAIYNTDLTTLMKGNEQFVLDTFVKPFIIDYINNEMLKL